ncbi:hypothetical protein BKA69DRAFT_1041046 [Paraphysoderma sedebokerense]|nr:hypothetical protein BKA69DRAFT_1041046 [Paraphysoderma sedebokerense]
MKIEGKVAIVTGGASGYGEKLTHRLLEKGGKVVIADINEELGRKVSAELNKRYNSKRTVFVKTDVTKTGDLKRMFEVGMKEFGKIDILANNAGIAEDGFWLMDKDERWKKVIDIDLTAVVAATHIATDYMNEGSIIINTASLAGLHPVPFAPVYAAAKHGVIGFTKSLGTGNVSLLTTNGIRVCAVAPFFSDTPLVRRGRQTNESFDFIMSKTEFVKVDTVVDAFIQLIEDESVNGAVAVVSPKGINIMKTAQPKL